MSNKTDNEKKSFNSSSWITLIGFIASILTIIQVVLCIILLPQSSNGENLWHLIVYQSAIVTCVITLCALLTRSQYKIFDINKQLYSSKTESEKSAKEIELKNRIIAELSVNNHNILHEIRQVQYKLYKHFINQLFIFNRNSTI